MRRRREGVLRPTTESKLAKQVVRLYNTEAPFAFDDDFGLEP